MKIVIFAGGVGTRLWPLSRKNSPKQFEKIIDKESTLQLTLRRLLPEFHSQDIYIATGKRYENIVKEQLPQIPGENFIFEPEMRDVGPAIGLVGSLLAKKFPNEPLAILWSDHMVRDLDIFKKSLRMAEESIRSNKHDFVFIAQKPRFANQNMGWIKIGKELTIKNGIHVYEFEKLEYRPTLAEAEKFFVDKNFCWNLGYFVTTPRFILSLYKTFVPSMYEKLREIAMTWETELFEKTIRHIYPTLERISFDDAILVKVKSNGMAVILVDIGWSDVGAWESLKEALSKTTDENITRGKVLLEDTKDTLVVNTTDQLCVGIDLKEMLIINTGDVLLVCPKKSVPKIKKLVESLYGTKHEHLA